MATGPTFATKRFGGFGLGGGGGGGVGGGNLIGAPPTGGSDAAGRIPGVTNPIGTISGNMGGIGGIIGGVTDQQLEALRKQYPTEYFATLQQLLLNTQRRAGGDISDLLPELQTRNAEAGIAGGYSGSAMENTKLLRDLGLTRYGVEQQALKDLGLIKAGTPTVNPYDPSALIGGLIDAQNRADIYRAAPDPEEAYKRARDAARGGGGGGGGGGGPGGGVRPGTHGGGAGASTVDDILKRYGGGLGAQGVFMARGTNVPDTSQGLEPAPWGSIPFFNQPPLNQGSMVTPLQDWEEFGMFGDLGGDNGGGWDFDDEYEDYGNDDSSYYDDITRGEGDAPGGGGGDEPYEDWMFF